MTPHTLGVGCAAIALVLTTLGAVLTLGASGWFIGAGLFTVAAALLVDYERLTDA
jgi:hypothetical protein